MLPFLYVASGIEMFFIRSSFNFRAQVFQKEILIQLLITGIMGNLMSLGFIWSAEYTIMSQADIFNGLGGAFIVGQRIILRSAVHRFEIFGTFIAICGCFLTLLDDEAEKVNSEN